MRTCIQETEGVDHIRQGDILHFRNDQDRPFACGRAVVITADCDLVQQKHYGQLLVCPILSAETYFENVWSVKRLELKLARTRDRLRKLFEQALGGESIDQQTLEFVASSTSRVKDSLLGIGGVSSEVEREAVELVECMQLLSDTSLPHIKRLIQSAGDSDAKQTKEKKALLADFRSILVADSSTDLVVLPNQFRDNSAIMIVALRCPFSVQFETIGSADNSPALTRICARFDTQITYLISQRFGILYTRIGMPTEFEIERKAAVELLEISL